MTPKTFTATTETVERIINCAAALFKAHGYKRTTVDEIAMRVSISKKTLYSVFPAKDAILAEATWRDMMNVMKKFGETAPRVQRPGALLLALCRFIFTDRIKSGTTGLFWGLYSEDHDIRLSYHDALVRIIRDIYIEGASAGIFKPLDPAIGAEIVTAILVTALDSFTRTTQPAAMFNDTLSVIADSVAFKERIVFDRMG